MRLYLVYDVPVSVVNEKSCRWISSVRSVAIEFGKKSMKSPSPKREVTRDTSLSYPLRLKRGLNTLKTYGEALDVIDALLPEQRGREYWKEIRVYLEGQKLSTRAHTTRLLERALKKDDLLGDQ